ncbi:DUF402 domain-containing protein [Nocardioides mesophilus]|uniref:DUF402 domain-containing protein n=1 Tax=Nocardioides mesophilus TaxID=433659 RepID=A0A7G9R9Z8_9ACTN|nr:DUF402 domain-containing protein [Nocardioides mesophilus]QNN52423.1 DUF402 domain-containing protein [Nocardioides mesophilus]
MHEARVSFTKWGGRPHWEYDAIRLGEDEHGTWLGAPAGTRVSRPGAEYHTPLGFTALVPRDGAFVATFYAHGATDLPAGWVEVYVDITTIPVWADATVTMVDLDLDVVRGRTGRVWIDDEDEFADHRVRFGYPADVVRLATASCERVHAAVTSRRPPYDGQVSRSWLSRLPAPPTAPLHAPPDAPRGDADRG